MKELNPVLILDSMLWGERMSGGVSRGGYSMKFRKFEGGSWSVFMRDFERGVVDEVS